MKRLSAGALLLLVIAASALFGPALWPHDPIMPDYLSRYAPPSLDHPLGTDGHGRDVFARILSGGRISLGIAVSATVMALALGTAAGLIAGSAGSLVDTLLTRLADALLAFPGFLLVLLVVVVLGGGTGNTVVALGIAGTPIFFRLARAYTRTALHKDYVVAARALGASILRVLPRHVLPNIVSPLFIQAASVAAVFLLVEASLSYLGLGVSPPTPTWGTVLQDSRSFLIRQPWAAVGPGIVLGATALSLQLLSDGMRDRLDPRGRQAA